MTKSRTLPVGVRRARSKTEAYTAVIKKNKVDYHLGTFPTVAIAQAAYLEAKEDPAVWLQNRSDFLRRHGWPFWNESIADLVELTD